MKIEEGAVNVVIAKNFESQLGTDALHYDESPCQIPSWWSPFWDWIGKYNEKNETAISTIGNEDIRNSDLLNFIKELEQFIQSVSNDSSECLRWTREFSRGDGHGGLEEFSIEFSIKKSDLVSTCSILAAKAHEANDQNLALCFLGH